MKTIPDSLASAQLASRQKPYVASVTLTTARWGIEPLAISDLFLAAATDPQFAACTAPDGSLLKLRITGSGDLYAQLTPPSQLSSPPAWSLIAPAVASPLVQPSAWSRDPATFNITYVRPDGYTLVRRFSTDGGNSWSGETVVSADPAVPVRATAIAGTPDNKRLILWAAGPNDPNTPTTELRYQIIGDPVRTSTLPKFSAIEGLAAEYDGDWHVIITGQSGEGAGSADPYPWGVFTAIMGDGFGYPPESWTGPDTLARADAAAGYRFTYPSLAMVGGAERVAFWAKRPGGPNRTMISHRSTFDLFGWTAPSPTGITDGPALIVPQGPDVALLVSERSNREVSTSAQTIELKDRLLSYRYREPGDLELVLSDADGFSGTSEFRMLRPGACVLLSRGLVTNDGPLAVQLPLREVAAVERSGGKTLRVRCLDALSALGEWVPNRTLSWQGESTVRSILEQIGSSAGIGLSVVGEVSTAMAAQPYFAMTPNESGLAAVRKLLEMVPERPRSDGTGLALVDPNSVQEYHGYGFGGLPLLRWSAGQRPVSPNDVQVYGAMPVFAEALDEAALLAEGHKLLKLFDAALSSPIEAAERASLRLSVARGEAAFGVLHGTPNLALERWDRVEVFAEEGAAAERWMVSGFEERCEPSRGEWVQVVSLGGVG